MFPVFSLVLDKDVKSEVAMLYPELYKDLLKVLMNNTSSVAMQLCIFGDTETKEKYAFSSSFFTSTGPTAVFQDFSNLGPYKYISR